MKDTAKAKSIQGKPANPGNCSGHSAALTLEILKSCRRLEKMEGLIKKLHVISEKVRKNIYQNMKILRLKRKAQIARQKGGKK